MGETLTPWSVNDEGGSTETMGEVINGMRAAKSREEGGGAEKNNGEEGRREKKERERERK